ncbi:MAG: LPS export ABC transporter permease LptG [Alphaproteobacteria bacterium]|nr:LPS export ABC transporter permease LptG [Alphaproteobacteria bacterium]
MRLPWTLSAYIGKHFLQSIMLALFGLLAISMLVDVVELLRRASGRDNVPFIVILQMSALKLPSMAEKLLPYAVLIGSMLSLTRLTRTQELVVVRAAGVSVWQFLYPAMVVVLALGAFMTTVFNPLASALLLRFEQVEGRYLTGQPSLLAVSASGLWLRQIEGDGDEHIIHALRISQSDMSFANVVIFSFGKDKTFKERLDAKQAVLETGRLVLIDVTRSIPGRPPQPIARFEIPTTLTLSYIQDSFASPETMSFWALPSFMVMLENAGFSALKHQLHWQSLLASPFLLAATVLIAAIFSLRLPRRGKVGILVVAGVLTGFLMHFFTDLIHALGAAGTLPVALAAWTPALVVAMIGTALLLQVEDG